MGSDEKTSCARYLVNTESQPDLAFAERIGNDYRAIGNEQRCPNTLNNTPHDEIAAVKLRLRQT